MVKAKTCRRVVGKKMQSCRRRLWKGGLCHPCHDAQAAAMRPCKKLRAKTSKKAKPQVGAGRVYKVFQYGTLSFRDLPKEDQDQLTTAGDALKTMFDDFDSRRRSANGELKKPIPSRVLYGRSEEDEETRASFKAQTAPIVEVMKKSKLFATVFK